MDSRPGFAFPPDPPASACRPPPAFQETRPMPIAPATELDLPYVVHLAQRHCTELGFLTRTAMAQYLERGRVTIARENGEPCGYFLIGADTNEIRIFQAAVQLDARGLAHGRDLLSGVLIRAAAIGSTAVTLHCRDGLHSNGFWSACGFQLAAPIFGGGARRKIVNTWRICVRDAIANPSLPYARRFLRAVQGGTAQSKISRALEAPQNA